MQSIRRLLELQLFLCAFISLTVLITMGRDAAISALLGGLVAFIPSAIFARKCFQHQGARAARQIVRNFYMGEFLKLFSSIALFAVVFFFYKVVPLAFFLTYITVVITHWFAPLIIDNKHNGPRK